MRKLSLLILASLVAIVVTGCGSSDTGPTSNEPAAPAAGESKPGAAPASGAANMQAAPGAGTGVEPGSAVQGK